MKSSLMEILHFSIYLSFLSTRSKKQNQTHSNPLKKLLSATSNLHKAAGTVIPPSPSHRYVTVPRQGFSPASSELLLEGNISAHTSNRKGLKKKKKNQQSIIKSNQINPIQASREKNLIWRLHPC